MSCQIFGKVEFWCSAVNLDDDFTECATGKVFKRFNGIVEAVNLFNDWLDIMFIQERVHTVKR